MHQMPAKVSGLQERYKGPSKQRSLRKEWRGGTLKGHPPGGQRSKVEDLRSSLQEKSHSSSLKRKDKKGWGLESRA